jgi:hypothetical protein
LATSSWGVYRVDVFDSLALENASFPDANGDDDRTTAACLGGAGRDSAEGRRGHVDVAIKGAGPCLFYVP